MLNKNNILLIRKYFFLSIIIFVVSFFLGFVFVYLQPETAKEAMERIEEEFSFIRDLNSIQLGLFIFFNNSLKILLFIFLGVLFGIPTLFFLVTNGFVLGFVIAIAHPYLGAKGIFESLFYHGIFELPALFLGSALGIWVGVTTTTKIKRIKKIQEVIKIKEIKSALFFSFKLFLLIILPLLAIAAIIETVLIVK